MVITFSAECNSILSYGISGHNEMKLRTYIAVPFLEALFFFLRASR